MLQKLSKFSPPQKSPPRFFFSPSVSTNFFTLFLHSFFGPLCFRFRLTRSSSTILFRARTLVVLRHGVLANWLVECFSLVVPNMVLSKSNIQKLVSQHTRGRYTFQPLWVSDFTQPKFRSRSICWPSDELYFSPKLFTIRISKKIQLFDSGANFNQSKKITSCKIF